MTPHVINLRALQAEFKKKFPGKQFYYPTNTIYIGRPTKWGNPFTHKEGTRANFVLPSRAEAVQAYHDWILKQPNLMSCLHELKGQNLVCWCAPAACHGDVLIKLANQE